eukprot:2040821-Rhodomonas_salina.2
MPEERISQTPNPNRDTPSGYDYFIAAAEDAPTQAFGTNWTEGIAETKALRSPIGAKSLASLSSNPTENGFGSPTRRRLTLAPGACAPQNCGWLKCGARLSLTLAVEGSLCRQAASARPAPHDGILCERAGPSSSAQMC